MEWQTNSITLEGVITDLSSQNLLEANNFQFKLRFGSPFVKPKTEEVTYTPAHIFCRYYRYHTSPEHLPQNGQHVICSGYMRSASNTGNGVCFQVKKMDLKIEKI